MIESRLTQPVHVKRRSTRSIYPVQKFDPVFERYRALLIQEHQRTSKVQPKVQSRSVDNLDLPESPKRERKRKSNPIDSSENSQIIQNPNLHKSETENENDESNKEQENENEVKSKTISVRKSILARKNREYGKYRSRLYTRKIGNKMKPEFNKDDELNGTDSRETTEQHKEGEAICSSNETLPIPVPPTSLTLYSSLPSESHILDEELSIFRSFNLLANVRNPHSVEAQANFIQSTESAVQSTTCVDTIEHHNTSEYEESSEQSEKSIESSTTDDSHARIENTDSCLSISSALFRSQRGQLFWSRIEGYFHFLTQSDLDLIRPGQKNEVLCIGSAKPETAPTIPFHELALEISAHASFSPKPTFLSLEAVTSPTPMIARKRSKSRKRVSSTKGFKPMAEFSLDIIDSPGNDSLNMNTDSSTTLTQSLEESKDTDEIQDLIQWKMSQLDRIIASNEQQKAMLLDRVTPVVGKNMFDLLMWEYLRKVESEYKTAAARKTYKTRAQHSANSDDDYEPVCFVHVNSDSAVVD